MAKDKTNFQNFPKHEVRSIIVPPKDHLLVSFDYAQLEARLIAMASKDEVFCQAIWDGVDTHLRWARRMAELYPKIAKKIDVDKGLRKDIKNGLVFPSFYGASPNSVIEHYKCEFHVPETITAQIHSEFWDVYVGVKTWQQSLLDFYNQHGYIESLTGRRRRAPLKKNEIINFPIQSSASYDICIVAGDRLAQLAFELNKPQYQYRIQIHDDLTFFIPIASLDADINFIAKQMVDPTTYDFINVPLEVEYSIGENWFEMKEAGKLNSRNWWSYNSGLGWRSK